MQVERFRFVAEMLGISALVVSLIFVGYEVKQTRDMNLAELTLNKNLLEHSRLSSTLESEHMLSAWASTWNMGPWDEGALSEQERAAAEINAQAIWIEFYVDFQIITLGFETRPVEEIKSDLRELLDGMPEMTAVWNTFWYTSEEPFMVMVNELMLERGA